ncbi:MAG: PEP-CTERM sorting domain-containing protein [Verrucomicrobia bacterium]|nr:MAG: PEP-CTERM sorting domain-containing protein [Verrucomicrobiota bacterium]TAE88567.1 MAG: PEP-CTERM sorting domain-containing protein [Verrucomicrobiota bacterium]TAF27022.1 MAG: PEP-CTERM sorting domain-containing protein [Verrucomicrobiota bacterium]TAF42278.1 MAG: PEP-CTERM sorting domain-containing protein [Verrucomicrobiota bacterium]
MKSRSNPFLRSALLAACIVICHDHVAFAGSYYWDNNSTTSGFGAAGGTWGTDAFWTLDSSGAFGVAGISNPLITDDLNFGSSTLGLAAGTVAITGSVNAQSLTFGSASGALVVSGGTKITLGGTGNVSVNNSSGTISTTLDGTVGLTKLGTGALVLNGSAVNTFTGGLNIKQGTLTIDYTGGSPTNLVNAGNAVSLGGGTLGVKGAASGTTSQSFNGVNFASGISGVTVNRNGGTSTTLNLGTITRSVGGVANFTISSPALGGTASTTEMIKVMNGTTAPGTALGAWAVTTPSAITARYIAVDATGTLKLVTANTGIGTNWSGITNPSQVYTASAAASLGANATAQAIQNNNGGNTLVQLNGNTLTTNGLNAIQGFTWSFTRTGSGGITVGAENELVIVGLGSVKISAPIADKSGNNSNVTMAAGGTLTLDTVASTYTGTTTVNSGTVTLGLNNVLNSASGIVVNGGTLGYSSFNQSVNSVKLTGGTISGTLGTLTSATAFDLQAGTVSGILAGSVGANKTTAGTLTLSGANTYTGDTRSNAGTLALGHVNALSASTLDMNAADAGAVTFTVSGSNTYNVGALKGSRNLSGNNNTLSIGGNNLSTEYSGSLGNGALTKTGSGTLTLSGANTHGGTTAIDNGTLAVTGSGSINSTSGVTIASTGTFRYNSSVAYTGGALTNNGGTITGTGDIGVSLTLDSLADKLAPGNSPGIQHYSVGQTWNSFTYQWETNDFTGTNAGTHFDQLAITGALSLTGGAGSYALDVLSLTGTNAAGAVPNFSETSRQWTVLTATDGISGFNAAYWNIVTGGFTSSPTWTGSFSLTADSNNIYLNYAAVPEPSAALLAGLGLLALWRRRRSLDPEFDASKPATDGISHPQPSQSCPSSRSLS